MKAGIFTSAGKGIGYGHYGRCRALKEGFAELDINADLFIQGDCDRSITGEDSAITDWISDVSICKGYDVCIADSYLTSEAVLNKIASYGGLCVFIDDDMRLDYPEGIVVNGSVSAEKLPYKGKPSQMILAGSRYAMLRRPFWDFDDYAEERSGIFLSAGGSGAEEISSHICRLLLDNTDEDIFIISGSRPVDSPRVKAFFGLQAAEMAELMSKRLFAVSAAGQTSYELARTAVPAVLFGFAENQRINLENWEKTGFALSAGFYGNKNFDNIMKQAIADIQDTEKNRSMSVLGPLYVDGQGVRRVVRMIAEVAE
ncbi:MAG: PseG/SpsG family protein [Deferribacterales bacterium]